MNFNHKFRLLIAAGVVVLLFFLLLLGVIALNMLLEVWDHLSAAPDWLMYLALLVLFGLLGSSVWIIRKVLKPPPDPEKKVEEPLTENRLLSQVEQAEEKGLDMQAIRAELEKLKERREAGEIHIALFGTISTGKSAIIRALLPDAEALSRVEGGSTRTLDEYIWSSPAGDKLVMTDMPGLEEAEGELDSMALDEAMRAHIVIYVTDSDLSRSQFAAAQQFIALKKPLIVTLNKQDQYTAEERKLLMGRLQERFAMYDASMSFALVNAGGTEEVLRVYPDGREEKVIRPKQPRVKSLVRALQYQIDQQPKALDELRDAAVFVLAKRKLDSEKEGFRREESARIVKSYTRKAILGALAAVGPGTDLIIQGVLGVAMVKALSELYDVSVKEVDIERLLKFSQGHVKKHISIVLAIAGNGLKAFPGIGTITGGLVHAVAYGMIFDALGKAVAKTLETRGTLQSTAVAHSFKETLSENLEKRAKDFAKLVFESQRQRKD